MNAQEVIQKYQLDKQSWTYKGLQGVLHFYFPVGEMPFKPLRKYYGDSHTMIVYHIKNNFVDWYWNNEDMTRLRTSFIEKVQKDPKTLNRLMKDWKKRLKRFDSIMKKIDDMNFSRSSTKYLLKVYNQWYQTYLDEYSIAIGLQDPFSMHADEFLLPHFKKILQEKGVTEFYQAYALLMSPVIKSFLTQEYREKLLLLKKIKKDIDNPIYEKNIKAHAEKWQFIHNNYAIAKILDTTYFKEKLREIHDIDVDQEIKKLDHALEKTKQEKRTLIKKLQLDQTSKNFIHITETFFYMQDERKKYVLKANAYQSRFINEFGKRLHVPRKIMEYTYIHELKNLFKQKKIDIHKIKERQQSCVVVSTLKGYELFSGKLAEDIFRKAFTEKIEHEKDCKGTPASPGKVRGKVKKIKKMTDALAVKKGDIIVTTMTRPDMMTGIMKAAAIVTDEGGITSHAAVISRELHIPCIIGTRIASKIFKDGDYVEVDANKGIVRRL